MVKSAWKNSEKPENIPSPVRSSISYDELDRMLSNELVDLDTFKAWAIEKVRDMEALPRLKKSTIIRNIINKNTKNDIAQLLSDVMLAPEGLHSIDSRWTKKFKPRGEYGSQNPWPEDDIRPGQASKEYREPKVRYKSRKKH